MELVQLLISYCETKRHIQMEFRIYRAPIANHQGQAIRLDLGLIFTVFSIANEIKKICIAKNHQFKLSYDFKR